MPGVFEGIRVITCRELSFPWTAGYWPLARKPAHGLAIFLPYSWNAARVPSL